MTRPSPTPTLDLDLLRSEINRLRTVGVNSGSLARFRDRLRVFRHGFQQSAATAEVRAEFAMLELEALLLWGTPRRLLTHLSGFRARHGRTWAQRAAERVGELGPARFPAETVSNAVALVLAGAMPSIGSRPPAENARSRKLITP